MFSQVQLPPPRLGGLELPPRSLPRGGEEDPVQGLWHQVCHHRPGESRWDQIEKSASLLFNEWWLRYFESQGSLTWRTRWSTSWLDLASSGYLYCNIFVFFIFQRWTWPSKFYFVTYLYFLHFHIGLCLLSFITMFCDFVLLNYVPEKKIVSFVFNCFLL